MTWVIDLDGVVWRGERAVPGAPEALARLGGAGVAIAFVTNNSSATVAQYREKLDRLGVPPDVGVVRSSAEAAASLVGEGDRVLVCAGPGAREAVRSAGALPVDEGPADAVVVGWHTDFDYHRLTVATHAVLDGARLIGTNDDALYPTEGAPLPGGGSILAAVAYATGVTPVVAGKPNQPIVDLLARTVDTVELVVGDRPSTDGLLARRLGVPFALVRSGVTPPGAAVDGVTPERDVADLATLVAELYPGGGST